MSFPGFSYGVLSDLVLELLSVLLEVLQREQRHRGGLVEHRRFLAGRQCRRLLLSLFLTSAYSVVLPGGVGHQQNAVGGVGAGFAQRGDVGRAALDEAELPVELSH